MPKALLYYPTIWSYGFAALVFAAFAIRLVLSWRGGMRAYVVLSAAVSSALWAALVFAALQFGELGFWVLARYFDVIRTGAWLIFLFLLLGGWSDFRDAARHLVEDKWRLLGVAALLFAAALLPENSPWSDIAQESGANAVFLVSLSVSIRGLALTEQLYRRTPDHRQWAIKPLVIGLAGMFAFDMVLYAEAVLFKHLDPGMWAARGVAHALVILFVAVATARNTSWTIELHVSRGFVFHTTAILIAGVGLLLVAAAGYWVREFGGGWGETLQFALVFAALLCVATFSLSGTLRSRLRVFISKNLFAYRYDYRKEWLRFTHLLGTSESGGNLHEKILTGLADLVESTGGALWLERDGAYRQVSRANSPEVQDFEPPSSSFSAFLLRTGWVVRLDEFARARQNYAGVDLPPWLVSLKDAWLVVPLPNGSENVGFVVLNRPRAPVDVNWEVLDLLKTASRQAASYLAQIRASDALLEAEKFDAFNRMSAFVVHDLKNLVAQLALLLKNAERHRDNPEFQKDMQDTIEPVVARLNRLMLQLSAGVRPAVLPQPIDIQQVVRRVAAAKRQYTSAIDVESGAVLDALAHEEQLERVIGHIVQNAIEAIGGTDGRVILRWYDEAESVVIEIVDTGIGMSEEFIRNRLFKPFQSTKRQGMGIGMNESFQYVSTIGGRIEVESAENVGTRFRVILRNSGRAPVVERSLEQA
ncbi:MAG: XrtA/PEP-CTERM system histidine kinase PrsK [Usitatibacteraceae bacterium]